MKSIIKGMLVLLGVAFTITAFAQAPNITYVPTQITTGVPITITPANTGGAVPATTYGQVTIFAGSPTETGGYTNGTGTAAQLLG